MKNCIVSILIVLHLMGSSLYATKTFVEEQKHDHFHYHTHNGSNHQHSHSHAQTNINLLDFFLQSNDTKECMILYSKEKYTETKYFISNPVLKSIFRPPIV